MKPRDSIIPLALIGILSLSIACGGGGGGSGGGGGHSSFTILDELPGNRVEAVPSCLSANGQFIGGYSLLAEPGFSGAKGVIWNRNGTVARTIDAPAVNAPAQSRGSFVSGISSDGTATSGTFELQLDPLQPGQLVTRAFVNTVSAGSVNISPPDAANWYLVPGLSDDGLKLFGSVNLITGPSTTVDKGFQWDSGAGMQLIPEQFIPSAVASDGSFAVGAGGTTGAAKWSPSGGIVSLPLTPGGTLGTANGISANRQYIAGSSTVFGTIATEAVIWPPTGNPIRLGWLFNQTSDPYSEAYGVSDNGSIAFGIAQLQSGQQVPFVWTSTRGMERAESFLTAMGLGSAIQGWTVKGIVAISGNGKVLVGYGSRSAGTTEGFVATLP